MQINKIGSSGGSSGAVVAHGSSGGSWEQWWLIGSSGGSLVATPVLSWAAIWDGTLLYAVL
jgi:hypothetical protein